MPTGISVGEIEMIHRALLGLAQSEMLDGRAVAPKDIADDFVVTGRFGDLYA